jgi:anaerobic magnesium-protoporphyrin IX monomethyl ester cyclase
MNSSQRHREDDVFPYDTDILLINPPFGPLLEPYISIPVLADYLLSRNINVRAYDANRALIVSMLNHERIRHGIEFTESRFNELNAKSKLRFNECCEYFVIASALIEALPYRPELAWLSSPFSDFSDIQESRAIKAAIRLILLPYFPEIVLDEILTPRLGRYSPVSTSDILASLEHKCFYSSQLEEIVKDVLNRHHPRIIGFSVVFDDQVIPAFQLAHRIKKIAPKIHITLGGPCISIHFRAVGEKRLFEVIDSLILDEGEVPLEQLLGELSRPDGEFTRVPGMVYCRNGRIHCNPPAGPVDMELTALPRYGIFPLDGYPKKKEDLVLSFRLSRGCSWRRCAFCRTDLYAIKHHQQQPFSFMYDRLLAMVEATGCTKLLFSDDSADPQLLEYISRRLIDDGMDIKWKTHTRLHRLLTREACRLYKEAGCIVLYLGVESLADRLLKLMKKGFSVQLVDDVLTEIGGEIHIGAYMIVGLPTETEKEARDSYARMLEYQRRGLVTHSYYSLYGVTQDSEVGRHPQRFGIEELILAPREDLLPNIVNFRSNGMSRQKAHELYLKFSGMEEHAHLMASLCAKLKINEEAVSPNFDLKEVFAAISSRWEAMYMREGEFIEFAQTRVPPLQRRGTVDSRITTDAQCADGSRCGS